MRVSLICLMSSIFFAFEAAALEICGDLRQGELVLINDGKKTYLTAFGRDEPPVFNIDGLKLQIEKAKWDVQSVHGVAQKKVTPSKKDEEHILREQKDLKAALAKNINPNADWKDGFILPVDGRISGQFGNQRIFNGIKKNPHTGTDIAAPSGTPVKAAGDGIVILGGKDYFYTGNMVIIDHGEGLKTVYAHLKDFNVATGDKVKKGDIIGHVGQTGRATGPHLHWGAVLDGVRFRPQSLIDLSGKNCRSY